LSRRFKPRANEAVHKAKIDIIRDDTALSQHHLGTSVELRLSKISHFSRMKPFRQTPGRDFQIFCYFATKPVAAITALVESTWSSGRRPVAHQNQPGIGGHSGFRFGPDASIPPLAQNAFRAEVNSDASLCAGRASRRLRGRDVNSSVSVATRSATCNVLPGLRVRCRPTRSA
jgi:hypothetical protein